MPNLQRLSSGRVQLAARTILTLNNHAYHAAEPELVTPRPRKPQNQLKNRNRKNSMNRNHWKLQNLRRLMLKKHLLNRQFSLSTLVRKFRSHHYQNLKLPPSCQPLPHTPHSANRPPPRRSDRDDTTWFS